MIKCLTYTWNLVRALESASLTSCKMPGILTDFIHPNNHPKKCTEPRNGIQLLANQIVPPWPTYTEPRAKRGRLVIQY